MLRWWWPLLFAPNLAQAEDTPILAIFELEDPKKTLKAEDRAGLRELIAAQLAGSGRFKVVPAEQVKKALAAKKKESYDACYAESCQISVGNELAASHTLVGSIQRFDANCTLVLTLYSLREGASVGAAEVNGGCKAGELAQHARTAAQKLARGEKGPAAQASTDYAALGAEAERAQKDAAAQQAVLERARAERLKRLEAAWTQVAKVAASKGLDTSRRVQVIEQFLADFADDNPRAAEAQNFLAALRAGKEPGAVAMVRVPAGHFFMGCNPKVDKECGANEKPGRKVQVAAFKIDITEVTVAAYAVCVEAGACAKPDTGGHQNACNWGQEGRSEHPVNCVDWSQADAYCRWAQKRLPTEVEWERAARGTDGRKYSWGNQGYGPRKVANIGDETTQRQNPDWATAAGYDDGFGQTAPVGSFPAGASPDGVLDMIGNVWEWVSDGQETRWVRGGGFANEPKYVRVSSRYPNAPGTRSPAVGFRCAANST